MGRYEAQQMVVLLCQVDVRNLSQRRDHFGVGQGGGAEQVSAGYRTETFPSDIQSMPRGTWYVDGNMGLG